MADQIEFCLVVERGALEQQAVLLCQSIRQFAGRHADAQVTAISPRPDRRPSGPTRDRLAALGVDYVQLDGKSSVPEYGTSYRVLSLAWRARQPGPATLVQLDSDTVFVDEPDLTLGTHIAAARPVDVVGMCAAEGDRGRAAMWQAMCRANAIELEDLPWVQTTIDRVPVRASYNGGLIAARRDLFVDIEECFDRIVAAGIRSFPDLPQGQRIGAGYVSAGGFAMWGTSQAAISIAIARAGASVRLLDDGYNVPLHLLDDGAHMPERLIHAHYHWLFNDRAGRDLALREALPWNARQRSWLAERTPFPKVASERAGLFNPGPNLRTGAADRAGSAEAAGEARPRCSVVMTAYNNLQYLREAVDSVLAQDFGDFEFILVDDGSRAPALFDAIAALDPRLRILSHATNIGTAAAANSGIAEARGDIIVRLDADDVAEPDRLRRLVEALDADPELGLVGSAVTLIGTAGHPLGVERMPETDLEIRWTLLFHNPFYHSAVAFRRECFDAAGGYRSDELVSQDHFLWADMLPLCRARNIAAPLVRYRQNPDGLTATHANRDPRARTHAIREAAWEAAGLSYTLYDDTLARDVSTLVRGRSVPDRARRIAAADVIAATLLRLREMRDDLVGDADGAAVARFLADMEARIAPRPPRLHRLRAAARRGRRMGLGWVQALRGRKARPA